MKKYTIFTLLVFLFFSPVIFSQGLPKVPAIHFSIYDTEDPCVVKNRTTYVVGIRNEGTAPLVDMDLSFQIPPSAKFVHASTPSPFSVHRGLVAFDKIKALQPGEKLEFKVTCKFSEVGIYQGIAILRAKNFPTQYVQEDSTTVVADKQALMNAPAMHFSCYDTEDPCYSSKNKPKYNTIYVLEARSEGTVPCQNVFIENFIPQSMKLLSAQASIKHYQSGKKISVATEVINGKIVIGPIAKLEPGMILTCKIKCETNSVGVAKNRAVLHFDNQQVVCEEVTNVVVRE
jgi:hypothetical protein